MVIIAATYMRINDTEQLQNSWMKSKIQKKAKFVDMMKARLALNKPSLNQLKPFWINRNNSVLPARSLLFAAMREEQLFYRLP